MKNGRWMLAGFCIVVLVFPVLVMNGCLRGGVRGRGHGYGREVYREDRHYYSDGRWYRHAPSGDRVVVSTLSIGAVIDSLPPSHTTVVVGGSNYYHDDNYYYRPAPRGGYIVVAPPVIVGSHDNRDGRGRKRR